MIPIDLIERLWAAPALVTSGCSVAIILTTKWHGELTLDACHGVQKNHTTPTSRIGGIAIALGLLVAYLCLSGSVASLFGLMLLGGIPAFTMGLAEDLTKRVGVTARLLATIVSGFVAWYLTGYHLTHISVWGIDQMMLFVPFAVAFTAFAVGGIANSINIIDGFNGLAGGILAICFGAMGFIAYQVGDMELTAIALVILIVLAGFLAVNFPLGKIFMGDGGAYLLGYLLAWMAVMLPMRNPAVSVWAPLVICAYPFNETIYSMLRRFLSNSNAGQPDSEHMHSLIKLKIIRRFFQSLPQPLRNGLVSPFCWIFSAGVTGVAIWLYEDTGLLMLAWAISFILYTIIYRYLARLPYIAESSQKTMQHDNPASYGIK
ncbi:glycosyl transferase [Chlorobium phaeovibrioides]|uniref:Glycosyl transferase n=1 Tax=Chlorobium phaeovibrioides TaxID=1094 RepID=A0ABW9US26_CHLPH|nr:glycosyltransferase [Chlorobium phaeovibrioides]MWV54945.1 glycosyl transferase [Chlorobium phaeovibrioides]RTY36024.1 glycosyl transferase [Chlorobium phaeovibrioides]